MTGKVLIIHTGGTIGMQPSEQGYIPVPGFKDAIERQLQSGNHSQLPAFDLLECDPLIDSSNLLLDDWTNMVSILEKNWHSYCGFIILHGTDTMAYSASALSFLLAGINKPVILTGSQIPLAEVRNDALDNLITSLIIAGNYRIPEVCICFNGQLLRGNRATKLKSSGLDAFASPNFPPLAKAGITIDLRQDLILPGNEPEFRTSSLTAGAVEILHTYPGMSTAGLSALIGSEDLKGLILQSYGAGNPPDNNKKLMYLLAKASSSGVILLNTTQCPYGQVIQGAYATGSALNRLGVISGNDITLEAAYTKLHVLISQYSSVDKVREMLTHSIRGEQS